MTPPVPFLRPRWHTERVTAANEMTKTQEIVQAVTARISSGQYAPDTKLPSIEDLAAEFGTSKHPPIEAYRILRANGLVTAEPRSGHRVAVLEPESPVGVVLGGVERRLARIERHLGLDEAGA